MGKDRDGRTAASYNPGERRDYGVTATLVDIATGEVRVEAAWGEMTTIEATVVIAQLCDELGPTWRIRTLSHPISILADLRNEGRERTWSTESRLLGQIGRCDLIERAPRYAGLRTAADYGRRRRVA